MRVTVYLFDIPTFVKRFTGDLNEAQSYLFEMKCSIGKWNMETKKNHLRQTQFPTLCIRISWNGSTLDDDQYVHKPSRYKAIEN